MSSDDKEANLEFFKSAILDPTFRGNQEIRIREKSSVVSDLSAIEAAHWARLGARIGYFDASDAQETISSFEGVFQAWRNLMEHELISPEDNWASVIRTGQGGSPALNAELFSEAQEIDPAKRGLLENTFQTFLLLTAENLLENHSRDFLDMIGWTIREHWDAFRRGNDPAWPNSAQAIGFGFANVLNYWQEMRGMAMEWVPRDRISPTSTGFSEALMGDESVWDLIQDARSVMIRRFHLSEDEIVDRYFELAGEFAERAKEDSPAWLDARSRIFEQMLSLVRYFGGGDIVTEERERLWNAFTKGIGGGVPKSVSRQADRPLER